MNRLDWIKDIEWKKDLKGDLLEIAERAGIDVLIDLWEAFGKTSVYFSEEALNRLRKKYIIQYFQRGKVKEIARLLDTSETYVYDIAKRKRRKKIIN